ncbi:hypothetical protein PRNP1_005323 [Phytophthora ramorum]
MIQPLECAANTRTPSNAVCYQIVAWGNTLPAFDPLAMAKTALLSPSSVKKFNGLVFRFSRPLKQYIVVALGLRFATFAVPASVGRVLAPITAVLHIPPMLVFAAGMRLDYMNIILRTFDFGFLFAANAIWAVVFSAVLRDSRATLVVICWGNFISSLFQETNLRNTSFMVAVTLCEWLFFVMLMVWLSLELVDDVTHYTVTTAQGGEISTKDLLSNVIGTMAMMSLRNLYQRYLHLQRHKNKSEVAMRAPGYRYVLVLGNWDLQDRVFLDFDLFGHQAQLRVAPFLLSRVFTIMVWSGRYVFIVLTRQDDNALILLRGNVEFDYERWKKQITQNVGYAGDILLGRFYVLVDSRNLSVELILWTTFNTTH